MKKYLSLLLIAVLTLGLLTGCVGTTVVVNDCTCPTGSHDTPAATEPTKDTQSTEPAPETEPTEPVAEGALKTGLAVSATASSDKIGELKYDVLMAAVTVDDGGVIRGCVIDSIPATVTFDAMTSDVTAPVPTKNELGESYGMVAYGGAKAEWNQQAASFAEYVIGKTADEVSGIAVDEATKPAEGSDLSASVTISVGGFVEIVKKAVANAQALGAQSGDELRLATQNKLSASEKGLAQLDADITAVTVKNGVVTSCIIDSLQAKVEINDAGSITTDLTVPFATKNELGENYGMVAYGNAKAEWNQQAAAFATYVTGKTADEITGIAVNEATKPADGSDLSTSVTISIGGFQALVVKALG